MLRGERNNWKGFRIIAVRVFADCAPSIRRALQPEETYFLCNDYKDRYDEFGAWVTIEKRQEPSPRIPSDFFSLSQEENQNGKKKKAPTVSISAVVGKNGDGKSSLIELILRIINNFGVAVGFQEDQESLAKATGVEASLFYEIDGNLHSITCTNGKVRTSFDWNVYRREALIRHQEELFYTVVANYSIYAYNARHFQREVDEDQECWINGVFHKNDSYQTPLVLNPMRTDGNFDVNREEDLCRQRLMALYADLGDDPKARMINGKKTASGFAFNLEERSKLETTTLKRFFRGIWKATDLNYVAGHFESYLEQIRVGTNPQSKESARNDFKDQELFWIEYAALWDKYSSLFTLSERVEKEIYAENNADYTSGDTDLKRYLETAKEAFAIFISDKKAKRKVVDSIDKVLTRCGQLTGLQFQRLVLIIDVCELWSKHQWFKPNDFARAIDQYVSDDNKRGEERCRALLYVVYKTISIFSQYKKFQRLLDLEIRYFYLFDRRFEDGAEYYNRLPMCFKALFSDVEQEHLEKKYDTLKLRQTINYLVRHTFKVNRTEDGYTGRDFGYSHYVTFDRLQRFIEDAKTRCDEETIALLPPPIFVGDILVRVGEDRPGNDRFQMSHLSSGELQMLNSIGTYLYHLRNLNYHVESKEFVEYSYVNLILEEVELYFHPEYQRLYINEMLRQIYQVHLENIKAINIILVTHSPFVLTDIPKNNVLFLQDGKPVRDMQENTFGANIHSLLQNGFFLEGAPMGEFAKEKINIMFERLHKGEYGEDLFEEIKLVSEPLLKTQLYQLYSLNKLPHQNPQYEKLERRIRDLEEKLNDRY